jgi:hypothetical protein
MNNAMAKLFVWDMNRGEGNWRWCKDEVTTDKIIKQKIIEALDRGPAHHFYMFECYNSKGEMEGKIYTLNPALFD